MLSSTRSTRWRLMKMTLPLVLIPLALVLVLSSWLAGSILKTFILEKLEYSNKQISDTFGLFADQMEDNMRAMIVNVDVQRSLTLPDFSYSTLSSINTYLKYYNYGAVRAIVYLDNRGNIIKTNEFSAVELEDIIGSQVQVGLTGTYGQQVWTFHQDDIFGESGRFLFITRYIRHLDLNVDPGILIFKIDPSVLNTIFDNTMMVNRADYLLVDQDGQIVFHSGNSNLIGSPVEQLLNYSEYIEKPFGNRTRLSSGGSSIFSYHLNDRTGWKILGIIPYRIAMRQLRRMQLTIYVVMLLAGIGTVAVVYVATLRFTNPIRELEQAMHNFRDGKFDTRVHVSREDEIGEMGKSYNLMADEISSLLKTIQKDQEDLTAAELASLAYQINPHFIYNTLDNVHMLARTSGDDRISRLILSLTKFLRISLSKGHNIISLADEFSHVEHYLNIQNIRFGDTFDFNVSFDPVIGDLHIVKFILQPLAENCISHGFRDIESGGFIKIAGEKTTDGIEITVEDNGRGIVQEICAKLNALPGLPTEEIMTDRTRKKVLVVFVLLCAFTPLLFASGGDEAAVEGPIELPFLMSKQGSDPAYLLDKYYVETFNEEFEGKYNIVVEWMPGLAEDYRAKLKMLGSANDLPVLVSALAAEPAFGDLLIAQLGRGLAFLAKLTYKPLRNYHTQCRR